MELEHCEEKNSNTTFNASIYGLRSTPRQEYEIATGKIECPPAALLDKKGQKVRTIKTIEELSRLDVSRSAKLLDFEVLSVVRVHLSLTRAILIFDMLISIHHVRYYTLGQCIRFYSYFDGCQVRQLTLCYCGYAALQHNAATAAERRVRKVRAGRQQV
jgi:hypothetical protein